MVVGLLSYLFITHYLGLCDDRGDGVTRSCLRAGFITCVSAPSLCSLVLSGWLYVTVLHPWDRCFAKEQYFSGDEIVLLRNFKSNIKVFEVVSNSCAVLLNCSGLFSEEQYEIKELEMRLFVHGLIQGELHPRYTTPELTDFTFSSFSCSLLCSCYIPSVMAEIRYASIDRAAGYWGILVRSLSGHLRIDIHITITTLEG